MNAKPHLSKNGKGCDAVLFIHQHIIVVVFKKIFLPKFLSMNFFAVENCHVLKLVLIKIIVLINLFSSKTHFSFTFRIYSIS